MSEPTDSGLAGAVRDDGEIAEAITRFIADTVGAGVVATVGGGRVTLSGRVDSATHAVALADLVAAHEGVIEVRSELSVNSGAATRG